MIESITARVGRIISGGVNQLIDAVENVAPETVMEQAIREVDSAIDDVRTELGKVVANKHLATRRLADAGAKHEDLAGKIELAIKEGREDLAEAAIAQQLDLEAQMPVLESTITESKERQTEMEGYITALQAKRREMKEELAEYRKTRASATAAVGSGTDADKTRKGSVESKVTKAENAFDRVLEKQTGLAGAHTDLNQTSRLAELEDLSRQNRIKERLAAAKARSQDQ